MPLYDFGCRTCGVEREVLLRMAEIGTDAEPECCGERMKQILRPAMVAVQGECHYVCQKTGEKITSRKQRAENFARHGLMDANDFTPDYLKRTKTARRRKLNELAAQLKPPPGVTLEKVINANPA